MKMTNRKDIEQVLWNACDSFRGKIDSSRYKDYILSMLFVKYLSDVSKERREEYIKQYDGDMRRVERAMSHVIDLAWAGDIVGINDPGIFNIGDTLTDGENLQFTGIPDFAPEYFARVVLMNPLKSKQMNKGLDQLSEEGATQLYSPCKSAIPIIGVVGELQFDVLKYRLEAEYGADVSLEKIPAFGARWVTGDANQVAEFLREHEHDCMHDKHGRLVCLFPNEYRMNLASKNFDKIEFHITSPY